MNWPGVTLHIPTSELGVMGEKEKEGRCKEREVGEERGPPSVTLIF